MNLFYHIPQFFLYAFIRNMSILDFKQGDVNGDGIADVIYLCGNKADGPTGIFADNIALFIQDGFTKKTVQIQGHEEEYTWIDELGYSLSGFS